MHTHIYSFQLSRLYYSASDYEVDHEVVHYSNGNTGSSWLNTLKGKPILLGSMEEENRLTQFISSLYIN